MAMLSTLFSRLNPSVRKTHLKPGPNPQARPTKKPLHALFTEAMGLSDKAPSTDDEPSPLSETATELKNNLKQLEQELKIFKGKAEGVPAKKMTLYAAFNNQKHSKPKEQPVLVKKLSPHTLMFVEYLFQKGYFIDANFAHGRKNFHPSWFTNSFAVDYVNFSARKFAMDNREIAKWLSGSALKQVAMFGCPRPDRRAVFPAKRLRKFFEVPENTVCSGCSLQQSCKFANQNVWKCETNNLDFVTVMKVIASYALESVHPQLVVPDEVKKSVNELLKQVVKLSQTT